LYADGFVVVEFDPVVVVGDVGEGTARMLGKLMKPNPATTPSITTSVILVLAPTFKPRSTLLCSSLL